MGKFVVAGIAVLLLVALGLIFTNRQDVRTSVSDESRRKPVSTSTEEQIVDRRAYFAIFTNGTFRVFTAPMYHNLSEDVFIQSDSPNNVRVKKAGVTWDNFFKTLPFSLGKDCLTTGTGQTFCTGESGRLKFYLNGVEDTNLLDKEIQHGDTVLVSFGNENSTQIQKQVDTVSSLKADDQVLQ